MPFLKKYFAVLKNPTVNLDVESLGLQGVPFILDFISPQPHNLCSIILWKK